MALISTGEAGRRPPVFEAEALLPTIYSSFRCRVYRTDLGAEIVAILSSKPCCLPSAPVRLHSACFTSEVLGSLKCDCRQQLDFALDYIGRNGGVVLHLPQEGRGIGLSNKIRAYALQDEGHDTVEANRLLGLPVDARRYEDAAWVLRDLGIERLRLITNNPVKIASMRELGFVVDGRIPVTVPANRHSHAYLETKRVQMGHWIAETSGDVSAGGILAGPEKVSAHPYVHLNFAVDGSGRMNCADGRPAALSCERDWQRVHELRERYAAVVVGARTWLQDRPRLTVRKERLGRVPERQPDRVVFAGRTPCRVDEQGRRSFIVGDPGQACGPGIHVPASDRDLRVPLEALHGYGLNSLLVEGGLTLLRSFVVQGLYDEVSIYVCTESVDRAFAVVAKLLPELPLASMEAEALGRGILLSLARADS